MPKTFFGQKFFWVKYISVERKWGSKKVLDQKVLGPLKIFTERKFGSEKNVVVKKIVYEKNWV